MRWIAALAALAGGLLAGCAGPGTDRHGEDTGPGPWPADPTVLVASWRYVGGFVPPEHTAIDPPRLAVYADGRAIADAHRVEQLAEVRRLVGALRRDLAGLGARVESTEPATVIDASSVVLQVRLGDGRLQSVEAYALGIVGGFPAGLVAGYERMAALADRVRRGGARYTSDRIRLVAVDRSGTDGPVRPWPDQLAVPAEIGPGVRVADLGDDAAATAIAALPRYDPGSGDLGAWPVLRTDDGARLGVAWRYLLPDE